MFPECSLNVLQAYHDLIVGQLLGGNSRYYVKPWTRAPAYLAGLLLGLCLDHTMHIADHKTTTSIVAQVCHVNGLLGYT
jgi:hypothetical protein